MGKISKTKLLKKGKYTPDAKLDTTSAPAKAEKKPELQKVEKKQIKSAKMLLAMRRRARMLKKGIPLKTIEELEKNEKMRTILCLTYGTYRVEDGTRTKTIIKRGKDHKPIGKEEIKIPIIYTGAEAVKHSLEKKFAKKYNLLSCRGNYIYISTEVGNVEDISKLMEEAGRVQVYKMKEKSKELEQKTNTKANKSGNNKSIAAAAKAKRKKLKKERHDMKPFYAAKRNGGVISKRIRMNNPKLAAKIEEWLKQFKELPKRSTTGSFRHKKRGTRSVIALQNLAERRKMRAKAVGKMLIQKEEKKAAEKLKAAKNAKKKAAEVAKKAANKEQKLKLAA